MGNLNSIFKKNSQTFYYCSKFFPKDILEDVVILYAFTRTIDNFIDCKPQQAKKYFTFKKTFYDSYQNIKISQNPIIESFIDLSRKFKFKKPWIDAFFQSMEMDITTKRFNDLTTLNKYMYGSSEVIGLMMSRIMRADKKGDKSAKKLGKAFQLINFIRDLKEDLSLGRIYFSQSEIRKFNLANDLSGNPKDFENFIRFQINKFLKLINEAKIGFKYIPRHCREAIKIATQSYLKVALEINQNPRVILEDNYSLTPQIARFNISN